MTRILNINMDEIDDRLVATLKQDYAHASVEIRVQEVPDSASVWTEDDFWKSIELLDWSKEEEDELVVEPLVSFLSGQPLSHIYRFLDILSEKLWHLDTRSHAQVEMEGDFLSVDGFLYARCGVVVNGKEHYYEVLNNPEKMPKDLWFEPILYVAHDAYERKMGKQLVADTAYNYETYSNTKGWE
jgi:hypothetical protein